MEPHEFPILDRVSPDHDDDAVYLEFLYRAFEEHYINTIGYIAEVPIRLGRPGVVNGKNVTFWHIVSKEGQCTVQEHEREVCWHRGSKNCWTRLMADNLSRHQYKMWIEERNKQDVRLHIATSDFKYLAVLGVRRDNRGIVTLVFPLTAYPTSGKSYRENLEKKSNRYKKFNGINW